MRQWTFLLFGFVLCSSLVSAKGFDEHYRILAGDIESDGDVDIFLMHAGPLLVLPAGSGVLVPIALDRPVAGDLLLRNHAGELGVEPGANPAVARHWNAAEGLALALGDFNSNDHTDAMIKRVGTGSAAEYLVFAPQGDLAPKLTRVNGEFRETVDTLNAWLLDRGYFDTLSAPREHIFLGNGLTYADHLWLWSYCNRYYEHCYARYGDLRLIVPTLFGMSCSSYVTLEGSWTGDPCRVGYHVCGADEPLLTQDFSGTLPLVADFIRAVQAWTNGTGHIESATSHLGRLLEREIGGLDFSFAAGFDDFDDFDEQKEFELVEALVQLWHALHGRPTAADTVYLTGHPVLRVGPVHTALEYSYPEGTPLGHLGPQLLSAGPKSGWLVFSRNRRSDRSNYVYGKVTSSRHSRAQTHFDELRQAAENYDDDLEYALFPEGRTGYNSNSFTAGLLAATEGQSLWPMTSFVGGGKPVPVTEFR
jgi:hypothetical protein